MEDNKKPIEPIEPIEVFNNGDVNITGTANVEVNDPTLEVMNKFEEYNQEKFKLWKKQVSFNTSALTKKEEQKAFQDYITEYNRLKFDKWNENQKIDGYHSRRTPEQITFNNYIELLQTKGQIKDKFKLIEYIGNNKNFDEFKNLSTSGKQTIGIKNEDAIALINTFKSSPNSQEQGFVFLNIPSNKITDGNGMTMTLYCKYLGANKENNTMTFTGVGFVTGNPPASGQQPQPPFPPPTPVDVEKCVVIKGTKKVSYNEFVRLATSKNYLTVENDDIVKKLKKGDYVIITHAKGNVVDKKEMAFNIYGKYTGQKQDITNQIEIDGKGYSIGMNTMSEQEIKDEIDKIRPIGPPQPQPGGTGGTIKLPTDEVRNEGLTGTAQEYGKYGVNLIDYKFMSRSPQLGVAGQYIKVLGPKDKEQQIKTDGHVIFNKYKHSINQSNSKYLYGGSSGLSGIKKQVKLHFDDTWFKTKDSKDIYQYGKLKLQIIKEELTEKEMTETVEVKEFTTGSDSLTFTPTNHGRYQIDLGTQADRLTPGKFTLQFQGWYGDQDMKPKGLDRSFEFRNYNGHILRANNYIKDEYYIKKLGNVIKRKVGIVKFSDLDWKHSIHIPGQEPHYIFAKVPYDCKVPDRFNNFQQMSEIGGKLMTNNLTEVKSDRAEHLNKIPVDKYPPYLEQDIVPLPWSEDHENPDWCFVIISSPDNAKRYYDLLEKTEITYELADKYQEPIYLQEGGFNITLSNGTIIHSYDYIKIEDKKDENCYILTSTDGITTIKINKFQIVDVSPNKQ